MTGIQALFEAHDRMEERLIELEREAQEMRLSAAGFQERRLLWIQHDQLERQIVEELAALPPEEAEALRG